MKCLNCSHMEPPPRSMMPGYCICPDDHNGKFKTLDYERNCSKFIQITEAQRDAKREQWRQILNPAPRPTRGNNQDEGD